MAPGPNILHADLDAFYASVEQLLDPSVAMSKQASFPAEFRELAEHEL